MLLTRGAESSAAPADLHPGRYVDARRPSTSKYCSAWPLPVRIAWASAAAYTGSTQPSYTQRRPSTECSVVPTSHPSAPSRGAAR